MLFVNIKNKFYFSKLFSLCFCCCADYCLQNKRQQVEVVSSCVGKMYVTRSLSVEEFLLCLTEELAIWITMSELLLITWEVQYNIQYNNNMPEILSFIEEPTRQSIKILKK